MTGGSIINNTATATTHLSVLAAASTYSARPRPSLRASSPSTACRSTTTSRLGVNFLYTGNGGGVFNTGTTVIKNSSFSGNRVVGSTANALRSGQGGGVFNGAQDGDDAPSLTVENSTITGGLPAGTLNATSGGGIANVETSTGGTSVSGALTLTNTELRGNEALVGGGVYNGGTVTAMGGLVVNNTAYSGGGVYQSPDRLAPANNPTATLRRDGVHRQHGQRPDAWPTSATVARSSTARNSPCGTRPSPATRPSPPARRHHDGLGRCDLQRRRRRRGHSRPHRVGHPPSTVAASPPTRSSAERSPAPATSSASLAVSRRSSRSPAPPSSATSRRSPAASTQAGRRQSPTVLSPRTPPSTGPQGTAAACTPHPPRARRLRSTSPSTASTSRTTTPPWSAAASRCSPRSP